ncbi:DUF6470 family protein [Mesobacillus selenatarsenatis]|uniref:YviE n=1 Tax=Mesobacillus selenatarsenatis (strain DSM 18680 / JCM 14380 / FERM P-15431 / SF-1) TaxID=1321606 RepID=A0A0A8WWH8_MESS1|nr:DUF6470 family protein [Mesobacillus selenatarsenatis]GAM11995.1 hypothetical protein SAMD00020551_0114 [Mesobacillus selenatarsenatis SF-1]
MQFPQIRLESTPGQISINAIKSNMEIEQPKAELSIEQPKADLDINKTPSRLTIEQTKAREDMDLKHISRRIEEAAQQGYQDWLAGLARVSQDGDEVMMIENGGHPIADQAKRNSESPMLEFNIGWIPSAGGVKIDYAPAKVDINWKVNMPIIESNVNNPVINYTPGKAEVSLKQHPSLKIDFENLRHVGINYEQSI